MGAPASSISHSFVGPERKLVVTRFVNPVPKAHDEWAVLSDGTIAMIRGVDYHIDWFTPNGNRWSDPPMPFPWRRVSDHEKRVLIDSAERADAVAARAGVNRYAVGTINSEARKRMVQPTVEYAAPEDLADRYLPMRSAAVLADEDANLWILTTASPSANKGLVYDVVNKRGILTRRVRLPADRTVVGFGPEGIVYMAARTSPTAWVLERTSVRLSS